MAMHPKNYGKRPIKPVSIEIEAAPAPRADEAAAPEPVKMEPAAESIVVVASVEAAPPRLVNPAAGDDSASEALDAAAWSAKTLELWSENANALIDLAEELGKAKSLPEAWEAQSRFATERLESLLKRSNEFVDLAQRIAGQYSPFRFDFAIARS